MWIELVWYVIVQFTYTGYTDPIEGKVKIVCAWTVLVPSPVAGR